MVRISKIQNQTWKLAVKTVPVLLAAQTAWGAAESVSIADLEALKQRLTQLEQTVASQAKTIEEQKQILAGRASEPAKEDEPAKKWHEKLDLAFGATSVLQGSAGADENQFDATMSLDFGATYHAGDNGIAYVLIEAGAGEGLNCFLPTFYGLNHDAFEHRDLRVSEMWYEHHWLDGKVRARGGWVDLTTEFDRNEVANCEHSQFLASGFVNNLAVEFPCDNGVGGVVWASPHEFIDVGAGIAEADADWDRVSDRVFSIGEVDLKPKFGRYSGNYRFYGWVNGEEHGRINNPLEKGGASYGFGMSLDQQLPARLTLFARYGWQPGELALVEHACSGGLQLSGEAFGRNDDALGVACGVAMLGSEARQQYRLSGANPCPETHAEMYYRLRATRYLEFTPDVQWVFNPEGHGESSSFGVLGLRARLTF